MLKIVGYGDRFSVAPGETIRFMVSAADDRRYRAGLLRIIHGDCNPRGPGFKVEHIASPFEDRYQGRQQAIDAGSYVRAPHHECCDGLGSFTLAAMVWPTTPAKGAQGIVCKRGRGPRCRRPARGRRGSRTRRDRRRRQKAAAA